MAKTYTVSIDTKDGAFVRHGDIPPKGGYIHDILDTEYIRAVADVFAVADIIASVSVFRADEGIAGGVFRHDGVRARTGVLRPKVVDGSFVEDILKEVLFYEGEVLFLWVRLILEVVLLVDEIGAEKALLAVKTIVQEVRLMAARAVLREGESKTVVADIAFVAIFTSLGVEAVGAIFTKLRAGTIVAVLERIHIKTKVAVFERAASIDIVTIHIVDIYAS